MTLEACLEPILLAMQMLLLSVRLSTGFYRAVCSQLLQLDRVSESRNVPNAPFLKRKSIATVSSTSNPHYTFDSIA